MIMTTSLEFQFYFRGKDAIQGLASIVENIMGRVQTRGKYNIHF